MAAVALILCASTFLSGCVRQTRIYAWGEYEEQVYALYREGGGTTNEQQIAELERGFETSVQENRPLPPGYYAHLGFLYYRSGRADQAQRSFEKEKQLFPESARYMDLLISRLTRT